MLSKGAAVELVKDRLYPAFKKEREKLDRIDRWLRWDHDRPHQPRHSTREYQELAGRSQTPWLSQVVTSVAQALFVAGYRRADQPEDSAPWRSWQANGMDARQIPLHRAALGFGHAYVGVLPGEDPLTGDPLPVFRGYSPRRMLAFYADPAHDDWPLYSLQVEEIKLEGESGWSLRVWDDEAIHEIHADTSFSSLTYIEPKSHDIGVCPVVRFANMIDLEGRTPGEVEPFIPVAARIDQTTFDRLVVQRFASWVVRTVSGMSIPTTAEQLDLTPEEVKLRLKVEDLLVADSSETKFGSLPATPLAGFIEAAEADIKALAAVSQTPVHEMLGQMANLSAEALAAARASLTAKVEERKTAFGESHEQVLRLSAWVMKDEESARDVESQVRWADKEIRSLAQAADALGKLAKMLGVPVEVLWEKIPGWTQQDVERAKAAAAETDSIGALARLLESQGEDDDES